MAADATMRALVGLLAPPRCCACARTCAARELLCERCAASLAAARGGRAVVPGVGPVAWAAPYDGIGGELVAALKFGARLGLARTLGTALAGAWAPPDGRAGDRWVAVAVPAAPARLRRRGFDPAELIAGDLASRLGLPRARPLTRADGPRQVGRSRASRRVSPPRVWAVARAPRRVLLVDDVLTTGATLGACAAALRRAGAAKIEAAVFARALGASDA